MMILLLSIIGVFIGIALIFSPLAILVAMLFALSVFCIKYFIKTPSRDFLIILFIVGFLTRVVLSILNYQIGLMPPFVGGDTQPDAAIYNGNAFYVAHMLKGGFASEGRYMHENPFLKESIEKGHKYFYNNLPPRGAYQYDSYVFFLGFLYAFFGYAPVAAKILNGLAGCLIAMIAYVFAKTLIKSETSAKMSAALTMFFPYSLYWSVTLLRDSIVNCLFLLYALSAVLYLKEGKRTHLVLLITVCAMLGLLKYKIPILLWFGVALFLTAKLFMIIIRKKTFLRMALFFWILVMLLFVIMAKQQIISDFIKEGAEGSVNLHKNTVITYSDSSIYKIYTDSLYEKNVAETVDVFNLGMAFFISKAVFYYFLSPFPWYIPYSHPFLLLFYPQVIFTFICLPFMAIGMLSCLRYNPAITISVIVLLALIILPQAMAEGIIGNVVRHRDMFMPFIIVFSSHGFYTSVLRLKRRNNLPN